MAKKLLIKNIRDLFSEAGKSIIWKRLERLPFLLRVSFGVFLIIFGVLGIFTPIPLGMVFFTIGLALFFGLKRTQTYILSFIHFTRLHILYSKIYIWLRKRKAPYKE